MYPDSAQKIRQRRLDEAPVAWSVGEDALADYEEGDDLYQYLYRVNGAEPIEGRLMAAREHEAVVARYTNADGSRMAKPPNGEPSNFTERNGCRCAHRASNDGLTTVKRQQN